MQEKVESFAFDSGSSSETPDLLYQYHALADGVDGYAAVTEAQIDLFHEQGYLVIHNAFSPEEVQSALDGLLALIDGQNPAFTGIQFEAKAREMLSSLPQEQKQDLVRKLMHFVDYDARLKALAEHPQLLGIVRRLLADTPVLSQDMALLKPPFIGREKPWHQDNAFFNLPSDTTVVAAWIALDEAVPENGCMYIIPGSHRRGPVVHFQRRDWQICDTDVAVHEAIAVPLQPGGCLLFHSLLHHGTPPSQSGRRRRALQYHYRPAGVTQISQEERLAIFGSEGKDVTC